MSVLALTIALVIEVRAQDSINLIAVEPFEVGRLVTGAPYTAEAVTETTQFLYDGNRMAHRTTARIARDKHGRIRRERTALPLGALVAHAPAAIITISDPVARVFITLDPERKVAIRTTTPDGSEPRPRRTIGGVGRGIGLPGLGEPPDARRPPDFPAGSDTRREALGTREIEGMRAEGTRTTTTIPAGAVGNQRPIQIISERWYAPELQIVVLTRRSDPRIGETVYRLANIVRAEPSQKLFQIPAGFRIEEAEARPVHKP